MESEQYTFQTHQEMLYKYLEIALDCGLKEAEFWEMTIAELNRFIESWSRVKEKKEQEAAAHNYILAGLIGRNIASYLSEEITVPPIEEIYSHLFNDRAEKAKEEKINKATEASVARFKQFANFHNKKLKL